MKHILPKSLLFFFHILLVLAGSLDNNEVRGSLNKFPDFLRMGTFIDSTHMKL